MESTGTISDAELWTRELTEVGVLFSFQHRLWNQADLGLILALWLCPWSRP